MIVIKVKICYHNTMENSNELFFDIFETIEHDYDEIQEFISSVEVMSDHKLYSHYLKKIKQKENIACKFKKYKSLIKDIEFFRELDEDKNSGSILEIQNEANLLLEELKKEYKEIGETVDESIQIEISSKEDKEFACQLVQMFKKFALNFDCEISESVDGDLLKLYISGENVYKSLCVFSGKVKKVLCGKESFANIVVLKQEETEIEINPEDLIIQTSKSSGAGGQHINKTESAVKIIHVPTGIFAECQDERSQTKNKEKAMQWLKDKITQKTKEKAEKLEKNQRNEIKNKLFSSTPNIVFDFDLNKVILKSEKIEYKLKDILEGKLDLIINNRL